MRSSAAAERQRALTQAEAELTGVRAELEELRGEIRAARKLERERGAGHDARRAEEGGGA